MIPAHFTPKLFSLLRQGYNFDTFKSDVMAGLTVAIVALPLSMALGIASGASPDKGLITAVIAGFLISFLGGSRVQIGGPTGAFIVVIFNVIAQYGYDGLILATLLAGIILVIAGYAKFGRVVKYIPYPVVTGFTAGIAVIIASSQIKDFLGLHVPEVPAEFIAKWQSYFLHIDTFSLITLIVGLAALLTIILLKRFAPKLPGYLIAVAITALTVFVFHLPVETIGSRFPDMPSGLPMPHIPAWDFEKFISIVPSAFTIAFLAGVESLLSAVVADGMTGYKHRSNQELVGQGVANIASAFFGGMPATGAIARTATNIKAGGKTPMAGMFHALFILLFILFATDIMAFVPLAALSAILFIVAWNMSEFQHFIHIFRLSKSDRTVMLLTFALTVLVDLTVAIGVGVTLASLLFMREMSKSVVLRSQGRHIRDIFNDNEEDVEQRDDLPVGVEVFRITGPLFFGVAGTMLETLQSMGEVPKILIIRMKLVPYMDVAGLNAMRNLMKGCHTKHTKVILSGLQPQPGDMLDKADIKDNHTNLWISASYDDAIALAHQLVAEPTVSM
ncbi:MAG TPA: sulfate permease [Alphaproteobacteria bacterium]|mgnify:CR=1 FL=1|nr:sulfate permease [Alphaproteobacteria bacterium]USO05449.1 MAG: sulfate permease [Rhodospirillales bacterium]HOO81743.1 sulfate permease [Alphaproteobacteria bacterium]